MYAQTGYKGQCGPHFRANKENNDNNNNNNGNGANNGTGEVNQMANQEEDQLLNDIPEVGGVGGDDGGGGGDGNSAANNIAPPPNNNQGDDNNNNKTANGSDANNDGTDGTVRNGGEVELYQPAEGDEDGEAPPGTPIVPTRIFTAAGTAVKNKEG